VPVTHYLNISMLTGKRKRLSTQKPEYEGDQGREQDAGGDWQEEGEIFLLDKDVAGESAQPRDLPGQGEKSTDCSNEQSENDERPADGGHLRSAAGRCVALFFAVDAAAVLLAVESHLFGKPYSFLPPRAEIRIGKADAVAFCRPLSGGADLLMVLVTAVEQGRGEGVKAECGSLPGSGIESRKVAVVTALCRQWGDCSKKLLKQVLIPADELQPLAAAHLPGSVQATLVLLVRVDIMVEEKTGDAVAGFAEFPERVEGARSAADVEEKVHGWNYGPNMADRSSGESLLPVRLRDQAFVMQPTVQAFSGFLPVQTALG
jgi:hypothetical protein